MPNSIASDFILFPIHVNHEGGLGVKHFMLFSASCRTVSVMGLIKYKIEPIKATIKKAKQTVSSKYPSDRKLLIVTNEILNIEIMLTRSSILAISKDEKQFINGTFPYRFISTI